MSLCRFFSWDSWDSWDSLYSFCTLFRAHFYTCSFFTLLGPFYFDASFCPFYMRTACVWSILLDLSVVFFFFCFLYINFCSDSFDIFGTFFTSVKFFASCTPVFCLFDTRFQLLCYQNDRKCQLCHVIFYPSFFFFRTLYSKTQR